MSAPLREALSRALARAPHADLGEHEARVLGALRGALALVGGPCAVTLKIDPACPWVQRERLARDLLKADRKGPELDAVGCAMIVAADALHDLALEAGRDAEASHVAA